MGDGHRGLRGHQYPQKIYSNEKQNQNTRFLGYRQNPNHGLTSTETERRPIPAEERLLRLLRELSKRRQAVGFLRDGRTRDHPFIYFPHKHPPKFSCGKYPKSISQERKKKKKKKKK